MSNITKIKISGTSYDIKDENACNVVELTQAQYDALPATAKTSNSLFVITDSQGADLSQYYTSAQTESAITQAVSGKVDTSTFNTYSGSVETALSGKQDTLSAGTGIDITDNVISATGGGGKAVSGGTNISITTGETADTINCTLPITVSKNGNQNEITFNNVAKLSVRGYASGSYSVAIGDQTISNGLYAIAIGYGGRTNANFSNAFGYYTVTNNQREFSTGSYNNSVTATTTFGDSGNTLFSVGNGTSDLARHNAFEIRQNGDIYITSGGTDIKLQDNLGGGGASYTAGTGIDITNDVISVSGVVMSSAVTSAVTSGSTDVVTSGGVYDQLGGMKIVKLTESEYTALVTKDSNTLYCVVPDPSN